MGIGIYTAENQGSRLSSDGTFSTPFLTRGDGRIGSVVETKLYIANDDVPPITATYASIVLSLFGADVGSKTDGVSTGFSWKMIEGATQPTAAEWEAASLFETTSTQLVISATLPLGTATYLPFWVRQVIPQGAAIQVVSGIQIRVTAIETTTP